MTPSLQKIAITGHTAGLGESLFQHFLQRGYPIEGFSRSNGYDLSNPQSHEQLVSKVSSCDIFINNAYAGWAQVDLLYQIFECWKLQPKHIINISSNSGDGIKNYVHPYAVQKTALDKASEQLNAIPETQCRVTNLRPGWLDTERIRKLNVSDPKISLQEMATLIEWIVTLPKTLHISTMSMTARQS
jgi:NADP-dependent 3-hydroxy acid dehydrogenase YdfG